MSDSARPTPPLATAAEVQELATKLMALANRMRADADGRASAPPISATAARALEDRIDDLARHYDRAQRATRHGHPPKPPTEIAPEPVAED